MNNAKILWYIRLILILSCVMPFSGGYAHGDSTPTNSFSTNIDSTSAVRFAVIGDYGYANPGVADVADLVDSWGTDFVITVGDNRYGSGNYDETVGQFYCSYLKNAGSGAYCQGGSSITNDFYPSLGNHDYLDSGGLNEYLNYFTLPGVDDMSSWTSGSERYYDFIRGPVHFFVLDSSASLESVLEETRQMSWLQSELAHSTTPWQVVYFHHAPYSSGPYGSIPLMQWPFADWGAEAVISGHNHIYERIHANGIVYFVNGLGGVSTYNIETPFGGSQIRYNDEYGALRIDADSSVMIFQFINVSGELIDTYTISEPSRPGIIDVWVENSFDDVEQGLTDGTMYMDSSDIELGSDTDYFGNQAAGLRFNNINIPRGAHITKAYLEFVVDETGTSATVAEIRAQDINDAPAFSTAEFDVTDRATTSASVSWDIPAWEAVDDTHQSPDLSGIVQEVIALPGWEPNNSMAFIITGTGTRTAESWDGEPASAALLHIEYSSSTPTNMPPAASFMASTSNLTAAFTDTSTDSDGMINTWSWQFGDGRTSSDQNPIHTYASDGEYLVTLTVTDNDGDSGTASQKLIVTAPLQSPSDLKAIAVSTSQINLSWMDNSDNELGFIIERSMDSINWQKIGSVDPDAQRYKSKKLMAYTTYYYRVFAYRDEDISEPSNISRATTHAPILMHVSSMDSSSVIKGNRWKPTAIVMLKDADGNPVSKAKVEGSWNNGIEGSKLCVTKDNGTCSFTGNSSLQNNTAEFTINNVAHKSYGYDPESNTVSSIIIQKPDTNPSNKDSSTDKNKK